MKKVLSLVVAVLVIASGPADAKDAWYDGIYLGAGVGGGFMSGQLQSLGLMPTDTGEAIEGQWPTNIGPEFATASFRETALTYKFFGGYKIIDYFALEGGYLRFVDPDERYCFIDATGGCAESRVITVPGGNVAGSTQWEVSLPLDGWTYYAVGIWPFADDRFELFGKLGGITWEMNGTARERVIGGIIPQVSPPFPPGNSPKSIRPDKDSGTDIAAGIGVNFNSKESGVTIRTEFEYFDIEAMDTVWFLSLSAIYNF